jgi:stage IV sporulation protein A
VLPMNLEQMKKEDIYEIIKSVLMEFPISSIGFYVPRWTEMLKKDHPLKMELLQMARDVITEKTTMRDIYEEQEKEYEYITGQKLESVAMDSGEVVITVKVGDVYYYEFLSETTGMEIRNEYEFIKIMGELAKKKKEYEEVGEALAAVKQRGYGVVTPTKEEIVLEEPQIVKHGSKYGVKIKASAPSIHMIRANISTEIAPIVGEEYQAKDLMDYIEQGSNQPGESMWDVNIFGKTLEQLVGDGMQTKALKMTDESQQKLQDTMEKIINESNGGLVCIII